MIRRTFFLFVGAIVFALVPGGLPAQKKKDAPKDVAPQPIVTLPLAIDKGKSTKLTVRGLHVDSAAEVRLSEPKSSGKIVGKGKSIPVPKDANASQLGDSEVEIEVTLPEEVPSGVVPFTLVGPAAESKPHSLIVNDETPRIVEKEPNNGFEQAQPIAAPQVVEGSIRQPQDVDVFRVEGKAGDRFVFEVQARRFGSPLEAMLTLYDAEGHILATAEGAGPQSDPVLKASLPRDGRYFLALIDANDQGGPIWVYRLLISKEN
jgi:hypothetical protein